MEQYKAGGLYLSPLPGVFTVIPVPYIITRSLLESPLVIRSLLKSLLDSLLESLLDSLLESLLEKVRERAALRED